MPTMRTPRSCKQRVQFPVPQAMSRYCPPGMGLSRVHKRSAIRGSGRLVVSYPRPILSYLTWVCVIVISFLAPDMSPGAIKHGPSCIGDARLLSFIRTVTVGSASHDHSRDQRHWSQCLALILRRGRHDTSDGWCIVALP